MVALVVGVVADVAVVAIVAAALWDISNHLEPRTVTKWTELSTKRHGCTKQIY